jgi:hypothetical protein|tara:strand:+ start:282 stop:497 length:216 start_codon:yes stop_codon:yes gene_type:complete
MQVVTVRFTGSMVKPSHQDCQIVEGSMSMRHDERGFHADENPPVCKIISPFGKDNTLEAFYMNEQWNCWLD